MTGDGATIFRHACGLGLEGIVSKRMYFEWYYTPEFSTSLERACLQRPDYLVAGWSLSGRTWLRRTVLLLCTAAIPA
jgi:ATP-dependent DNA ligase